MTLPASGLQYHPMARVAAASVIVDFQTITGTTP
jgi:hypothetical protein